MWPHGGAVDTPGCPGAAETQCLGYCDRAPCLQVDAEETVGPLTPDEAVAMLDQLRDAPAPAAFWR